MGCSVQKRLNEHEKNAPITNSNSQQFIFQSEMHDSNIEILISIKTTPLSKGMVQKYNQMYPDPNTNPDIDQNQQQGNIILLSQNVSKSLILQSGTQKSSQKANSDYSTYSKGVDMHRSQNLRSLLKSNIPQGSKQQKNVTFQLRSHARSPLSDKQFRKQKVTIEHLERIF